MNKVGETGKRASLQEAKNLFSLRLLQVVGAFFIGVIFTVLGTILWTAYAGVSDSLSSELFLSLLIFVFGPGVFVAFIVAGGHVHDDINLVIAQIANVVIYGGLGYIFIRFLEWRRSKTRKIDKSAIFEREKIKMVVLALGVILLLVVAIPTFWYWEGENFSDGTVSGTYFLQLNGESSTLVLRPDHSFQQELDSAGTVKRVEGNWRVFGEGHIAFSPEFLKVSGEELSPAEQVYGQIQNWFGLVSITLAPNPNGPTFHKELFR
jgi:hypothetical protein